MNDKKANFIDRKGEAISKHSVVFDSTVKGLTETVSIAGAGMSFANSKMIEQAIKNGDNIYIDDGKSDRTMVLDLLKLSRKLRVKTHSKKTKRTKRQ